MLYRLIEIYVVYKLLRGNLSLSWISKLIQKLVTKYFYEPLQLIGQDLLKMTFVKRVITDIGKSLYYHNITTPITIILFILIYQSLPLLMWASCLYLDVFIFSKINLFYHFFYLFIWTYSLRGILGLILMSSEEDKRVLEETYFDVTIPTTLIPTFYAKQDIDNMEELQLVWLYNYNLLDLLKAFHLYKGTSKILLGIQLLTATIFSISWLGLIYKVLLSKFICDFNSWFIIYIIDLIFP